MVICKTRMNCYLDGGSFKNVRFGIPQYFRDIAKAVFRENFAVFHDGDDIEAFVFRRGLREISFVRREYAEEWKYYLTRYSWIPLAEMKLYEEEYQEPAEMELYEEEYQETVEWRAVVAECGRDWTKAPQMTVLDGKNMQRQEIVWELQRYFNQDDL